MAMLCNLLFVMGWDTEVVNDDDDDTLDIISELPVEISTMILRKLDGESLKNALLVNKRWNNLCKSDRKLRMTLKAHSKQMKRKREEEMYGVRGDYDYVPNDESNAFKRRNRLRNSFQPSRPARVIPISESGIFQTNEDRKVRLVVLESNVNKVVTHRNDHCPINAEKLTRKRIPKSQKTRLLRL